MAELEAVKAKSTAFGNYIDLERKLADLPHLAFVEVDVPEYTRSGLGRVLMRVVRYHFQDIDKYGVEGMSLGADSSRGHMIYEDMNPTVVGMSHEEIQSRVPGDVLKPLYAEGLSVELVSLAVLRHARFASAAELLAEVSQFHRRASWLEAHPVEVRFANIEAASGEASAFDWERLLAGV
jgi:hypothetical protein